MLFRRTWCASRVESRPLLTAVPAGCRRRSDRVGVRPPRPPSPRNRPEVVAPSTCALMCALPAAGKSGRRYVLELTFGRESRFTGNGQHRDSDRCGELQQPVLLEGHHRLHGSRKRESAFPTSGSRRSGAPVKACLGQPGVEERPDTADIRTGQARGKEFLNVHGGVEFDGAFDHVGWIRPTRGRGRRSCPDGARRDSMPFCAPRAAAGRDRSRSGGCGRRCLPEDPRVVDTPDHAGARHGQQR
ncbi:hypothetical protein DFR72_101191 [Lentzea flaviverrucosa]|uniref:Uncharacterized protein n=1 Tax=Lentzea flaviverrucosa TaxID=200379 RepID=A0A1H9XW24_9PSEU|nr:hypothetical protein DFR72_101191 [Lentzea flaviverrucosa]SES50385.1 hypothetical protein SAMN05216195_12016 [Lentzea flaviverrucosa]